MIEVAAGAVSQGAEEAADLLWSRSGIEQWLLVQVGEQFGEHMCHAIQPAGTECSTEALARLVL